MFEKQTFRSSYRPALPIFQAASRAGYRATHASGETSMHDFLIAVVFIAIVMAPCVFAMMTPLE